MLRAGDRLTPEEIATLLEQRELAQDSDHFLVVHDE
jgi:hypothetical protein